MQVSRKIIGLLFAGLLLVPIAASYSQNIESSALSSHWVPGWGFRDELNASDIDHENFWTDNAGKILTMAVLTNDTIDASRALWFLENHGQGSYMPETVVNSSMLSLNNTNTVTNRIALLQANNQSDLQSLAIGNYYASQQILGYIGSDRILIAGNIYRSSSSQVFESPNQFVKRSFFNTPFGDFYSYLNATLSVGHPYAEISLQVLPLNSTLTTSDILYLQAFSTDGQFNNVSLYNQSGSYLRALLPNNGSPSIQNGTIIAYSNQSVFNQDSIALSFSNATSPVDDFELWHNDGAFNGLSWMGVAYNAPQDPAGSLSAPIFAKVYPIEHMDYRLINDTARYMASDPKNTTVSPPVSFGFVAYGLALAAMQNASLINEAKNYWNFYYSRYNASGYSTAYARSINTFALAGFTLYGCNSTVESFARSFIGNTSGTSIEENGWAFAALYHLQTCTLLPSDHALYESFLNSFQTSESHFILSTTVNAPAPSFTFQFAEAASGLMLGGVPYNARIVLGLMNAVYQSNVSGTVLNQPFSGDLANTETLPAYMLSTWLFQSEMKNQTGGYAITGLDNVNLTSIDAKNGTVLVGANGRNGTIEYASPIGTEAQTQIEGFTTVDLSPSIIPTVTQTVPTTITTTVSHWKNTTITTSITVTTSTTVTTTVHDGGPGYLIALVLSIIFLVAGVVAFILARKRRALPASHSVNSK
ncbi:MAG: hypothetical protein ACYC7D_15710 [Nitrososphaerales archaeon]